MEKDKAFFFRGFRDFKGLYLLFFLFLFLFFLFFKYHIIFLRCVCIWQVGVKGVYAFMPLQHLNEESVHLRCVAPFF